jgi:hypothetical protein
VVVGWWPRWKIWCSSCQVQRPKAAMMVLDNHKLGGPKTTRLVWNSRGWGFHSRNANEVGFADVFQLCREY